MIRKNLKVLWRIFLVLQMSSNTISRASLQGMPGRRKQGHINNIVDNIVSQVTSEANTGKTSYMYDPNQNIYGHKSIQITTDELVSALKIKFPDCDVSYEETWVEISPGNKVLKKGIVINWS